MRLCASGKRSRFFMPHGNPSDIVPPRDGIGDSVEGVPCHAVDSLHACCHEPINEYFRTSFLAIACIDSLLLFRYRVRERSHALLRTGRMFAPLMLTFPFLVNVLSLSVRILSSS
jgi:hypothetical protein